MSPTIAKFSVFMGVPLIAACTNIGADYEPILDGAPGPTYQADLAACQNLAATQDFDNEQTTATVAGAGLGGLIAVADDDSDDMEEVAVAAAIGGAIGAGAGAAEVSQLRKEIITECLRGRGHNVVG